MKSTDTTMIATLCALALLVSCSGLGDRDLAWIDFGTGVDPNSVVTGLDSIIVIDTTIQTNLVVNNTVYIDTSLVDLVNTDTVLVPQPAQPEPQPLPSAPQPNIGLSAKTLAVSCMQGSSPAAQSFAVWNDGAGRLEFQVSESVAWLSVSPLGGISSSSSDIKTCMVNFSCGLLPAGTYSGAITISGLNVESKSLLVTLTVAAPIQTPRFWGLVSAGDTRNFSYGDLDGYDNNNIWICGVKEREVYTLPDTGIILKFDGAGWQRQIIPEPGRIKLVNALHVISPVEVYAVALQWDNTNGGNERCVILKYNGFQWAKLAEKVFRSKPTDIHALSENDIYVCTEYGTVYRVRNKTDWQDVGISANRIDFLSPTQGYAGGYTKYIYQFDGLVWTVIDQRRPGPLHLAADGTLAVLGADYNQRDSLWLFDGRVQTAAQHLDSRDIGVYGESIFARSGSDIWVGATGGTMLHYEGGIMEAFEVPGATRLRSLWFSPTGTGWAAGAGKIFIYR